MKKENFYNLFWKVTSFVFAIILWFFVINSENPVYIQEFKNIPVTTIGLNNLEESEFVLMNPEDFFGKEVDLLLKGPRLQIDKIQRNPKLINVKADFIPLITELKTFTGSQLEYPVKLTTFINIAGLSPIRISEEEIVAFVEKKEVRDIPIECILIGESSDEYKTLTPIVKPNKITISGSQSLVSSVDKAIVEVQLKDLNANSLNYKLKVKVIDKNKEEVTGVHLSHKEVDVLIPIGKKMTLPVNVQFEGQLPNDYGITNVLISPSEITVVGTEESFKGLDKIELQPISLDNHLETFSTNVQAILPENVQQVDMLENGFNVTIEIKKRKNYMYRVPIQTLSLTKIGLDEDEELKIVSPFFNLSLSATAEELLLFNINSIKAEIDLSQYDVGKHKVPISIQVPNGFEVKDDKIYLEVEIQKKKNK